VRKETVHIAQDWRTKSQTCIQYVSCNLINCEVYACVLWKRRLSHWTSLNMRRKNRLLDAVIHLFNSVFHYVIEWNVLCFKTNPSFYLILFNMMNFVIYSSHSHQFLT
jgi:hypothetical protein